MERDLLVQWWVSGLLYGRTGKDGQPPSSFHWTLHLPLILQFLVQSTGLPWWCSAQQPIGRLLFIHVYLSESCETSLYNNNLPLKQTMYCSVSEDPVLIESREHVVKQLMWSLVVLFCRCLVVSAESQLCFNSINSSFIHTCSISSVLCPLTSPTLHALMLTTPLEVLDRISFSFFSPCPPESQPLH